MKKFPSDFGQYESLHWFLVNFFLTYPSITFLRKIEYQCFRNPAIDHLFHPMREKNSFIILNLFDRALFFFTLLCVDSNNVVFSFFADKNWTPTLPSCCCNYIWNNFSINLPATLHSIHVPKNIYFRTGFFWPYLARITIQLTLSLAFIFDWEIKPKRSIDCFNFFFKY